MLDYSSRKWEQADVVCHFTYKGSSFRNGGGAMIEAVLLEIIYLLLFALVVETIIVFALIIFVIFLSK